MAGNLEERLRAAEEALWLGRGVKRCEEMKARVLKRCLEWKQLAATINIKEEEEGLALLKPQGAVGPPLPAAGATAAAAAAARGVASRTPSRPHLVLPPLPDTEVDTDLVPALPPTSKPTPAAGFAAAAITKEQQKVGPASAKPSLAWLLALAPSGAAEEPMGRVVGRVSFATTKERLPGDASMKRSAEVDPRFAK